MPSHPAAFLAGERCQVWALRRDNGQPVYLPDGSAAALREFTKKLLRCPYPGCTAQISTRGGSKRDHFFHVSTTPHETGLETENHLAAKAMIANWLRGQVPEGASVREEEKVKGRKSCFHRRPDVLVTGATGRQVAYEIEYKNWAIADWLAKQDDFDEEGITSVWLIGHTRVRLATDGLQRLQHEVVVPALAAEIAQRAAPLLIVNPQTREIGTLTDRSGDRRYGGERLIACLHVDALDDCRFSPVWGIRTPTMLRIEQAERERAEAAARREGERLAEQQRLAEMQRQTVHIWQRSPLHERALARWGTVPEEFGHAEAVSAGIDCVDAHWRMAIFEELIERKTAVLSWPKVRAVLVQNGIAFDKSKASPVVRAWLGTLTQRGLVRAKPGQDRSTYLLTWEYTACGRTLEEAREWISPDELARRSVQALAEQEAAAKLRREQDLAARMLTKEITLPDGKKRWVRKAPGE